MQEVGPSVWLFSAPQIRWEVLRDFLREVDPRAEQAADRMQGVISDGEALVETAGRECYRSWVPEINPNVTQIREDSEAYLRNILSSGHGSVLQHANYTFILHNVSRVFTHEMVRHTAGVSVSQESMRFVRLTDIPFWFPEWAREDADLMSRSMNLLRLMESHQEWMATRFGLDDPGVPFAEKKHKTSFMRRFAPEGVATGMVCTMNIRALRHIIYMRTALGAEEEIRVVFDKVAQICQQEFPHLMQDYSPNEWLEWIPEFLKV